MDPVTPKLTHEQLKNLEPGSLLWQYSNYDDKKRPYIVLHAEGEKPLLLALGFLTSKKRASHITRTLTSADHHSLKVDTYYKPTLANIFQYSITDKSSIQPKETVEIHCPIAPHLLHELLHLTIHTIPKKTKKKEEVLRFAKAAIEKLEAKYPELATLSQQYRHGKT
jgi:hypothetical protein